MQKESTNSGGNDGSKELELEKDIIFDDVSFYDLIGSKDRDTVDKERDLQRWINIVFDSICTLKNRNGSTIGEILTHFIDWIKCHSVVIDPFHSNQTMKHLRRALKDGCASNVFHKNGPLGKGARYKLVSGSIEKHQEIQRIYNRKRHNGEFGYSGVSSDEGMFEASIHKDSHAGSSDILFLGSFDTKKKAALAYDDAAIKLGRPVESLNFPDREVSEKRCCCGSSWSKACVCTDRAIVHEVCKRKETWIPPKIPPNKKSESDERIIHQLDGVDYNLDCYVYMCNRTMNEECTNELTKLDCICCRRCSTCRKAYLDEYNGGDGEHPCRNIQKLDVWPWMRYCKQCCDHECC